MKDSKRIFIVEDDPTYASMLKYILELNPDHEVYLFDSGKKCLENLHLQPVIVTLDYSLPDMTGREVLKQIREFDKDIYVIILSGQSDVTTAVSLVKEGAYDYLVKDRETKDKLLTTINHIHQNRKLKVELESLQREVASKYQLQTSIKGNSEKIKQVFELIQKAANTNITVSITGETGTGKELVAKSIHYNSPRKNKPFVAVNIAAIPKGLIESELFGHEKGAFTDAITRRTGKFEQADGGTLFIDEIGELDINIQAKLLRVLQEKEFTRVGGNETIKLNARIIVATHKDLREEIKKGNFRSDLYYRILGLPIHLPPLRERGNDILILAKYFLDEFCKENNLPPKSFAPEALSRLLQYRYPGNVRELKAIIELAAVMANSNVIQPGDIHFHSENELDKLLDEEVTLKEYNQRIIRYFLHKYDNNVIKVAQKLGIGKSTIYRMLKEMRAG